MLKCDHIDINYQDVSLFEVYPKVVQNTNIPLPELIHIFLVAKTIKTKSVTMKTTILLECTIAYCDRSLPQIQSKELLSYSKQPFITTQKSVIFRFIPNQHCLCGAGRNILWLKITSYEIHCSLWNKFYTAPTKAG